jgi:hypothetical protein
MANLWNWVRERREEYKQAGDEERLRLTQSWFLAFPYRERDPDQAVALLLDGCRLAKQLGEEWWIMVSNHWLLDGLMHFQRDCRQVVELAVSNSLMASKPENLSFPGRWMVYRDLACAYLCVDPEGYADDLSKTLNFLDREIPPGPSEERNMMLGCLAYFHEAQEDYVAAEAVLARKLELIDSNPNRRTAMHAATFVYSSICAIAHRKKDWEKLADAAALGEEAARIVGHQMELCEFLMWQASLARRVGDELRARPLHTTAVAKMARIQMSPGAYYEDALALFHELGGEIEEVLQLRERELVAVAGKGRLAYESDIHRKRCTALAQLGRLNSADIARARQAAQLLRKPEKALAKLDALTGQLSGGQGK